MECTSKQSRRSSTSEYTVVNARECSEADHFLVRAVGQASVRSVGPEVDVLATLCLSRECIRCCIRGTPRGLPAATHLVCRRLIVGSAALAAGRILGCDGTALTCTHDKTQGVQRCTQSRLPC